MAAKQGTLAQLSQAGEDAKRAVLSRTGVTSSWFSNLNTVCTIKSAPPRSPEVLQMLATKSGWLLKRNEQHVWQVRWCCAVPHTFLYYFDANVVPSNAATAGSAPVLTQPTQQQQEEWNHAVANGYGNRKQHEKRSNFYLFNNHNNLAAVDASAQNRIRPNTAAVSYNNTEGDDSNNGGDYREADLSNSNFSPNMQPAGIIDLECYTTIHRSSANPNILELAGDDQINPDLRAFYFCASSESECEDWTDALLNKRHSALQDDCEAYKQVCDGFVQQLQMLHSDLEEAAKAQEEADAELYRVRCQMEESRRTVRRLVEECFDRTLPPSIAHSSSTVSGFQDEFKHDADGTAPGITTSTSMDDANPIYAKRLEFSSNFETIHSQDMGVAALVRLLTEYCSFLEDTALHTHSEKALLEKKLKMTGRSDQERVRQLENELESMRQQKDAELNSYKETVETLQRKYQQSQKELQDVQNDLSSTRMEVTMYQTQQKTKIAELQQHKKILKKEVLDLRNAMEEKDVKLRQSELRNETDKMTIEQEKSTIALLERYISKIESQVHVQQNMMEMMSQSGMGSVFGGGGGGSVYIGGQNNENGFHHQPSTRSLAGSPRETHSRNGAIPRERDADRGKPTVQLVQKDDIGDSGNHDDGTEDMGDVEDHLLRPVNTTFCANNSNRTAQRGNRNSKGNKFRSKKVEHIYSPQRRKQQRQLMIEQDIDNKSHVSELTEDRTQRHFDAYNQFALAANAQNALSSPRTFDVIHSEYAEKKMNIVSPRAGPPLHIIGVSKNSKKSSKRLQSDDENDDSPGDTDDGDNQKIVNGSGHATASTAMLDTINSGVANPSLPPMGSSPGLVGAPNGRRDIPRGGNASVASRGSYSGGKISVAQRSRIEADQKTTQVRVALDENSISTPRSFRSLTPPKLLIPKIEADASPSQQIPSSKGDASVNSASNSQKSRGLWKRVEEAVLGSKSDDDDDDDSFDSESSESSSDPDYTKEANDFAYASSSCEMKSKEKDGPANSKDNTRIEIQEEKKSPEQSRPLTLAERQKIQREKQINFLRQHGLVKDGSDIRGGAGANPTCDAASVGSSNISHSRSFLSFGR